MSYIVCYAEPRGLSLCKAFPSAEERQEWIDFATANLGITVNDLYRGWPGLAKSDPRNQEQP